MRIGITGHKGLIGSRLVQMGCVPLDCYVTNPISIQRAIASVSPEAILHLAYKSSPDWCELPENTKAMSEVNLHGSYNVFNQAEKLGVPVVFISSDHVFGGSWFEYKESSTPKPVNQYGLSKMAVEAMASTFDNVKIVRSSTVFSYEWDRIQDYLVSLRSNHVKSVPTFIKRNFIYLDHFVEGLLYYVEHLDKMPKILHIAGTQSVSWYEFVRELARIFELGGKNIHPRHHEEMNYFGAPRPHNIKLSVKQAKELGVPLYSFVAGINKMYMEHIPHDIS